MGAIKTWSEANRMRFLTSPETPLEFIDILKG